MMTSLVALQHADSAFPSGSFAFSNGLEGYLAAALDGSSVRHFVEITLRHRWIGTDRVALVLAFRDPDNLERLAAIDEAVEAATLAEPLRSVIHLLD